MKLKHLFVLLFVLFPSTVHAQSYGWANVPEGYSVGVATNGSYYCTPTAFSFQMVIGGSLGTYFVSDCNAEHQYQRRSSSPGASYVVIDAAEFNAAVAFVNSRGTALGCGSYVGCSPPCDPPDGSLIGENCCGSGSYGSVYYVGQDGGCDVLMCNTSLCATCPPPNTSLIGLNCCASGYGSTWTIGTNSWGCSVLTCNDSVCHSCPNPPPTTEENTPCQCEGGGEGAIIWDYDSNGCPVSTRCDGCEDCEDPGTPGGECRLEDGSLGKTKLVDGNDGCPELVCDSDPCSLDANANGTPDYLDGNVYAGKQAGDACTAEGCSRDTGKIVMEESEDGCPVPKCQCECDDKGGDADNDNCCDDEDPDPDDPDTNCNDCTFKVQEKISAIVQTFRDKLSLPQDVGRINYDAAGKFELDLNSTSHHGITAFGVKFGGNIADYTFWWGSAPAPGGTEPPTQGELVQTGREKIEALRTIISACVYLVFARQCFSALFHPAR